MKKFFKFLLYFFLVISAIGILAAIFSPSETKKTDASDPVSALLDTAAIVPDGDTSTNSEPSTKWTYSETVDKMTDKKSHFAQIEANDLLQFEFPYDGGVTATLTIRNMNGARDVVLNVSKGQFMPNTMETESVMVRFDNKPAQSYSYQDAADGSSETIFLNNKKRFISDIKKSKKLIIESSFYDNGKHTMEFDTEGLDWKY
jgi:hypothetical protein